MSSLLFLLVSFLLAFHGVTLVKAGLYVVEPFQDSTCHGGEPCTVTWLDDGRAPLLSTIGLVTVGLYTGEQQLVQSLEPVDVSAARAFTFTPNPAAGPSSGAYYIGFRSTEPIVNGTEPYSAWSPWFRLDRMTGSFESPLESATSSIPIPQSLSTRRPTTTTLSTITVGTLSTAKPTITTSSAITTTTAPTPVSPTPSASSSSSSVSSRASSSGFVTSRISSSATPSAASSSSTPVSRTSSSSSASASVSPSTSTDNSQVDAGAAFATTSVSLQLMSVIASLPVLFYLAI